MLLTDCSEVLQSCTFAKNLVLLIVRLFSSSKIELNKYSICSPKKRNNIKVIHRANVIKCFGKRSCGGGVGASVVQ